MREGAREAVSPQSPAHVMMLRSRGASGAGGLGGRGRGGWRLLDLRADFHGADIHASLGNWGSLGRAVNCTQFCLLLPVA